MKGYRTLAFNGIAGVLLIAAEVIQEFGYSQELQYFISEETMPYLMLAILAANVVLRVVTTTPVASKFPRREL